MEGEIKKENRLEEQEDMEYECVSKEKKINGEKKKENRLEEQEIRESMCVCVCV